MRGSFRQKSEGVNELPLCDLKATEGDAETRQLVQDYAAWFGNR
jgi:hypothetical protein